MAKIKSTPKGLSENLIPQKLLQLKVSPLKKTPNSEEFNIRNFTNVNAYYRIIDETGTGKIIIEIGCVELKEAYSGEVAEKENAYLYLKDGSSADIEIIGFSNQPVLQSEKLETDLNFNFSLKLSGKIGGSKTGPGVVPEKGGVEKLPGKTGDGFIE